MIRRKSKKGSICLPLVLYYLLFNLYVAFPFGHSKLDDLYEGRVTSFVVLGGIHRHPSDVPYPVFDHHTVTTTYIDPCLICTQCTTYYPAPFKENSQPLLSTYYKDYRLFTQHIYQPSFLKACLRRAPPASL